jgi:SMEK domain
MNLQKSIYRIIELFGIFSFEVERHNKMGLFDINRLAEDVLIPIFRDAYDCQFLRNLNKERKNYPGLDLGDDEAGVGFQISSDPKIDKVKETLSKVIQHQLYLRYETVYIYILTKRQSKYSKAALQQITKGTLKFIPDEHIIDSTSLIEKIKELDYPLIKRIEQTLEVHFASPTKYFIRPAAEKKSEIITLNIMPISFPDAVFVGKANFKREEIIQNSRSSGKWRLSHKSSQRSIVWAALEQQGLTFTSDWVIRSDEIITFRDLRDDKLPLAAIVDSHAAEPIPVDTYIRDESGNINVDRLNILKELLRTTFQAQIKHRGIIWQHQERLFIFVTLKKEDASDTGIEKREIRREPWSEGKKEGRIVYQEVMRKDDPTKRRFYEHLAFQVGFEFYDERWYMAIRPDLFCSWNRYKKSAGHKSRVSFVKRNEHNPDVLTDLRFITEILRKDQSEKLINQNAPTRIVIGGLVTLDGAPPIDDKEWQKQDEKRKRKALESKKELPLFNDYVS